MPIKKINVEEFKLILIRFSEIQEALVAAFLELSKTKGQWPTKGTILLNNERWAYRKHGAGVCFTSKNTGEEIDAHSGIEQKPYKKTHGALKSTLHHLTGKSSPSTRELMIPTSTATSNA